MTDPIYRDLEKHEDLEVTIRRRFEKAQRLAERDIQEWAEQVCLTDNLDLAWALWGDNLTTKYFHQLEDAGE